MIGKAVTALILSSTAIKNRIGGGEHLYPVSDFDKGMDAIYYIVKAMPGYVKNGPTMTKWNVSLLTQCRSYEKAWELSMLLKQLFDSKQQKTFAGIKFTHLKCTSITDDYEFTINNYGTVLQFEITTPNLSAKIS